jgi:hypothetical protein
MIWLLPISAEELKEPVKNAAMKNGTYKGVTQQAMPQLPNAGIQNNK